MERILQLPFESRVCLGSKKFVYRPLDVGPAIVDVLYDSKEKMESGKVAGPARGK